MKLTRRISARSLNLAKHSEPKMIAVCRFMFGSYHFHKKATLDTTDSDEFSGKTFFIIFTKKNIHVYSPKLVVTLLQVFPNLFSCVYFLKHICAQDGFILLHKIVKMILSIFVLYGKEKISNGWEREYTSWGRVGNLLEAYRHTGSMHASSLLSTPGIFYHCKPP